METAIVLGAQVYLVDETRSLSFEEKLIEPENSRSTRLEGIWWLPSSRGDVKLVLSNTTNSLVTVTTNVAGTKPKRGGQLSINLMPHETRVIDIRDEFLKNEEGALSRYGGISVEHNGSNGAVLARAMSQDPASGFSLPVQFLDPKAAKSTNIQGAGLRLSEVTGETFTPVIIARNTHDVETVLTGRVPYTTVDGVNDAVVLPKTRLAPGEIVTFDIRQAMRKKLRKIIAAASLEFKYTGEPGTVHITAHSVSADNNQVFRVPMWDIAAQRSATGGYPWFIEGDSSTTVYIKNVTAKPQQFTFQLDYHDGGAYATGLKPVEPGQTVTIDVRALRDNRTPDEQGRTIPLDASSGQILWSAHGADDLALMGRSEQADLAKGYSSNYACQNCCQNSFYDGWISPSGASLSINSSSSFATLERDSTCYGTVLQPYNIYSASWSSQNTAVVTTGSYSATGRGPGGTNINATWTRYQHYYFYGYPTPGCRVQTSTFSPSVPTTVTQATSLTDLAYVSTGDTPESHPLRVTLDPPGSTIQVSFSNQQLANYGGTSWATLTIPPRSGPSPVDTTIDAAPAGSSGEFRVRAVIAGQTQNPEGRVVVPPQILIQMMSREAGNLPAFNARYFIGWAVRNRFADTTYFSGQSTYSAAIAAAAQTNPAVTNGPEPELSAAARAFSDNASVDPTGGAQGWWSPTPSQWATVSAHINSSTLPANVGAPSFISSYPRQYIRFISVGTAETTYPGTNTPAFLFVRKRPSGEAAVIQLN